MKTTVKESCIVRPAEDTPKQRLWLSNLDQLFVNFPHVSLLHPYNPDGSHNFFDARVMKQSLAKTLVAFFPVAGRLAQDETGRFEIDCSGQGVLFAEAEIDASMSELGDFSSPQLLRQFFPEIDYSRGVSSLPLLLIQVTRFRCGGVCLGIGLQHVLCDGEGLSNFMTAWSNQARDLPITSPPLLDRTFLRSTSSQPLFQHPEYQESTTDSTPTAITSTEIHSIPTSQIKHLRDMTHNRYSSYEGKAISYSTYEVMAAHIWRCVTVARRLADQRKPITLHISVDGRQRFNPPLPPGYFGNCVFHAKAVASPAELASESLEKTAERIRRAIGRIDDGYMRSVIDYLDRPGDETSKFRIPGNTGSPDLKIISWTRMSFLPKDFGWGDPMFTRSANPWEGKCHILPRSGDDDENVPLAVCLEPDAMERFKGLFTSFTLPPQWRLSPL
ncbi:unnamed protein product [Linum tenue]|uniref:Uncharacterized protein n=1 Tax=Linum tenue TaxID=586396 RepID=A0AAV0GSB7_9ROSI|nr:unnamed protein product [Linum tenue]